MNSKEYYSELRSELIEWKGRIENVLAKFDSVSCEDKERLKPYINDFSQIVAGLSDKIERLGGHCPTEYPSYSGDWEFKSGEGKKTSDDLLNDANPT